MLLKTVVKRDGRKVPFDAVKIQKAIEGACSDVLNSDMGESPYLIASGIEDNTPDEITVEQIQDIVEQKLMEHGFYDVAKAYIRYRYEHELARQKKYQEDFDNKIWVDKVSFNTSNNIWYYIVK